MNIFVTILKKSLFAFFALLLAGVWQSWVPSVSAEVGFSTSVVMETIGSWNRLTDDQRFTLKTAGAVNFFDTGLCDAMGNPVTVNIASDPAPGASDPSTINARFPRRWGQSSFYLARETPNGAGVQYCFEFSVPAPVSIDSREHAYFAQEEVVRISAERAGVPVDLSATFFGNPAHPAHSMSGNGTPEVTLNAYSTEGGGLWWEVNSQGAEVTRVCVQYYSTGGPATVEPIRIRIEADKCVPDDPVVCGGADWISRWNRLNTTQRTNLLEGEPVYGFHTGFCDESADAITFLEISAGGAIHSGNPAKNGKEPRPYGLYSFDNGRHFAGMGGNTYCYTFDEARPIRLSSQEHRFFQGGEVVRLTAFLGADPVVLEGMYFGGSGTGPVVGTSAGLTLNGFGYGNDTWWNINSDNRPVSQVCVEYYVEGGAPLSRQPFALGICADRCLYDDPYACSQTPGPCAFPLVDIQKSVTPANGFGLNLCDSAVTGLPVFDVVITMTNYGTSIKQLFLEEDLMLYFGSAFDHLLTPPVITYSNAAGAPLLNPGFNGISDTDLFSIGTGALYSGQQIEISFSVELNPNAPGAQPHLLNSVYGGGVANGGYAYNDVSGGLPGGPGVRTAFENLPAGFVAIPAQDLTLEATIPNFMNGIDSWLNDNGGAEFFVPGCAPVSWTNDYDPANRVQGCGQITGSIEVNFTATDACSHVFNTCATFTLEDTHGPTCTKPDDLTLDCNDPNAQHILDEWLDYDGNYTDLSTPVTFTHDFTGLGSAGCNGDPITVTWTATDACGNSSTFSATLTVVDHTAPAFAGVPADLTLDRCDDIPPPANVTASDGCDPNPELTFDETQTGDDCHFTIIRTWTATDDCGNSGQYVQTITVADDNPPVFSNVPADITAECPDVPPVQDPDVTDCSSFTVVFDEIQIGGACPVPSQIIRTWTATDECGNADSVTQIINMISPMNTGIITFDPADPTDITAACSENPDFDDVQASTTCPAGGLSVSVEDVVNNNGDCSQPFSVTRTWIAHDACGNMVTVSQTINIGPDNEAPIFHTGNPTDITVDCGDDPVLPIAFDNCGPTALSYEDSGVAGDCASGFTFTRTWTAADLCGNSSVFTQNVTTSPDTSPPVFTFIPYDQFFDCDDPVIFDEPVVFDNCSEVTLTFRDSIIGTGDCNEVNGTIYGYDIIRTWIATDACGNVATAVTNAWIIPGYNNGNRIAFAHVPEDRTISCGTPVDFGQAVCHSVCSEVTLTFEDFYEENCTDGTTITRIWMASDTCGNTATATQYIRIDPDTEPPVFTDVPADDMFDCHNSAPVFGTPTVTDNCTSGASVEITYTDVWENGGDCNSFTVTRIWTATDPCGNQSTASQTLTLMDDQAPVFSAMPQDYSIACGQPVVFDQLDATDECSTVELTFSDVSENLCDGTYAVTRTWVASDACGNISFASQKITVLDQEPPVFVFVPADLTVSCGAPIGFGQAEASDACSFATLTYEDQTADACGDTYTLTRTWTATDGCGNFAQAQQKITVVDNAPPVFQTEVQDQFIPCDQQPVFDDVVATDDCGSVSISYSDTEEVLACETVITRTWRAVDPCGNTSQLEQSIHLVDNEAPVFSALPAQLQMTQTEYDLWTPPAPTLTDCGAVTTDMVVNTEANCDFTTYLYQYSAMDECGNASFHTLEVLITDAAFAMSVTLPDSMDCGSTYDLLLNTDNGTAPFAYSWQILSGNGWQVDAMPGEPAATVLAGEGEAVLNISIMDAAGCVVSQQIVLECEGGVNAVHFAQTSAFELQPNPVNDHLSVGFESQIAGNAFFSIVNTLGSRLATEKRTIQKGLNRFSFDTAALPAGTYFIVLHLEEHIRAAKFVKIQ
ncbi:MAG TPA: T9SS type A sorting domain-containing protein [Bacteroidetes bacterium]|nr:T9SS type A sorting domain-containing protein [Bacteroidota bacterium]